MAQDPHFVFIVGCPHSGTTILHRLFSMHAAVLGIPGESGLFLNKPNSAKVSETLSRWRAAAIEERKTHIVEKTPWHGLKIDQIGEFVPGARFVFILRNPIDTYGSLKHRGATNRITDTPEGRISTIAKFLRAATECELPRLTLESFVRKPALVLADMLRASGVSCSPTVAASIMAKHTSSTTDATESSLPADRKDGIAHRELRAWQVTQPIFSDTRNRQHLAQAEIEDVVSNLTPLVAELSNKVDLSPWQSDFRGLLPKQLPNPELEN